MAAGDYVRAAADQLRRAIEALEDDIRRLEHDEYDTEAHLKSDIGREETESHLLHGTRAIEHDENKKRVMELREQQLENDVKSKERQVEQQKAHVADIIRAKNNSIYALKSAISQIERLETSLG